MKLRKLLLVASPVVLTIAPVATTLSSCAEADLTPKVNKAEHKEVPWMKASKKADGTYQYTDTGNRCQMTHFNDSMIGYVDIDEYVKSTDMTYIESSTSNGVTTITNTHFNATAKINFKKQTITFSDYDAFKNREPNEWGPLTEGAGGGENYFTSVEASYKAGKEYVIDLTKYNIKAYYHEDKGYLPYEIMNNIFDIQDWFHGEYNGKCIYQLIDGNKDAIVEAQKAIRSESSIYTEEYLEYTYNLLALTLDHRFGLKERISRAEDGKTIKFMEKGAYAMLAPYHDRLVSTKDNVSNEALKDIFTKELDDGGHARYRNLNTFTTCNFEKFSERGTETKYTFKVMEAMEKARAAAGLDPDTYWQSQGYPKGWTTTHNVDSYYTEYTDPDKLQTPIAYITFDGFNNDEQFNWTEEETVAGRELPTSTNASNYWQDTMRLTMYANQQIREHNVKDVVIDISCNGGGTVYTEHFIASWLCKGVTEKVQNPVTGAYCEYTVKADINGDKVFDENDYLADDVNVYLITSSSSFSCGNMLPCNVNDNRPNSVIIGHKSGGGACFVDSGQYTGTGSGLRSSSTFHMLRGNSTAETRISNDIGCDVTYHYDELKETNKYFDRSHINDKIWGKI